MHVHVPLSIVDKATTRYGAFNVVLQKSLRIRRYTRGNTKVMIREKILYEMGNQ